MFSLDQKLINVIIALVFCVVGFVWALSSEYELSFLAIITGRLWMMGDQ